MTKLLSLLLFALGTIASSASADDVVSRKPSVSPGCQTGPCKAVNTLCPAGTPKMFDCLCGVEYQADLVACKKTCSALPDMHYLVKLCAKKKRVAAVGGVKQVRVRRSVEPETEQDGDGEEDVDVEETEDDHDDVEETEEDAGEDEA